MAGPGDVLGSMRPQTQPSTSFAQAAHAVHRANGRDSSAPVSPVRSRQDESAEAGTGLVVRHGVPCSWGRTRRLASSVGGEGEAMLKGGPLRRAATGEVEQLAPIAQLHNQQGTSTTDMAEIEQLKEVVAKLQKEVTRLSDQEEVRKLQYKYGYYLDKCLYKEVADLYSDHPDTCVEFLGGRFNGKEGVKRLYIGRFAQAFVDGRNGPVHGFLLDHPQIQGIVDVSPDGTRAKGRFRSMMAAGTHESIKDTHPRGLVQWWEGGIYENEYIKEDGTWKIFRLKYFPFWHAEFGKGWSHTKPNYIPFLSTTYPDDPLGASELCDHPMLWPDTRVVPFHYEHPITGVQVADDDLRAPEFGKDSSTSAPPLVLSKPKSES